LIHDNGAAYAPPDRREDKLSLPAALQTRRGEWTGVIEQVAEKLRNEKKFETRNPKFEKNPNDQIA